MEERSSHLFETLGKKGEGNSDFFFKMLTMHGRKVEIVVWPPFFSTRMDLFFARASLRRCKKKERKRRISMILNGSKLV